MERGLTMEKNTMTDHNVLEQFFALGESDPTDHLELRNAVAIRLLAPIQGRLPQCGVSDGKGHFHLTRAGLPRIAAEVVPLPQRLFMINWADSGPGISWPEDYYVAFVPGFEHFVVTASMDSPDCWGFTDLAIGSFAGDVPLKAGARAVITGWWSAQHGEYPWAYVWGEGLISQEIADGWRDEVWPPDVVEEDDFGED